MDCTSQTRSSGGSEMECDCAVGRGGGGRRGGQRPVLGERSCCVDGASTRRRGRRIHRRGMRESERPDYRVNRTIVGELEQSQLVVIYCICAHISCSDRKWFRAAVSDWLVLGVADFHRSFQFSFVLFPSSSPKKPNTIPHPPASHSSLISSILPYSLSLPQSDHIHNHVGVTAIAERELPLLLQFFFHTIRNC